MPDQAPADRRYAKRWRLSSMRAAPARYGNAMDTAHPAASWRHQPGVRCCGDVLLLLLAGQGFDSAMSRPGALLQNQTPPFCLRAIPHAEFAIQLVEQLPVPMFAVGNCNR